MGYSAFGRQVGRQRVTVPMGVFDTIEVELNERGVRTRLWLADHVGVVRAEFGDSTKETWELRFVRWR